MKKSIRTMIPSAEVMAKVNQAKEAIVSQQRRYLKCPYCGHNSMVVYEDTRGHVETKCKKCGNITVFDVLSMRIPSLRFPVQGR